MTSTTEETRAVAQGIYDASKRGDRDAVFALVHDDIVVEPPAEFPWRGPHNSASAWRENALPMIGAVHDRSGMKVELVAEGDRCIAIIEIGLNGVEDVVQYIEVWTVRDGKASAMKVYCHDPRPIYRQIERLGIEDTRSVAFADSLLPSPTGERLFAVR